MRTGWGRHPLQDENHSGSGPRSFSGFHCLNTGLSSERVRSEPWLVGSEEVHLVLTRHPKSDSLSYWDPETVLCYSTLKFLRQLSNITFLKPGKICVPSLIIPRWSSWSSLLRAADFLLLLGIAIFEEGKKSAVFWKRIDNFYFVIVGKMQESNFYEDNNCLIASTKLLSFFVLSFRLVIHPP